MLKAAGCRRTRGSTSSKARSARSASPISTGRCARSRSGRCCCVCSRPRGASTCRSSLSSCCCRRPCSTSKAWAANSTRTSISGARPSLSLSAGWTEQVGWRGLVQRLQAESPPLRQAAAGTAAPAARRAGRPGFEPGGAAGPEGAVGGPAGRTAAHQPAAARRGLHRGRFRARLHRGAVLAALADLARLALRAAVPLGPRPRGAGPAGSARVAPICHRCVAHVPCACRRR